MIVKNATTGVVFARHFRQPHGLEPLKQFSGPPHEIPMDLWVVFPFLWVIIADITVRFELLDQNLLHFSFCASPVSPPKPRPLRFSKAQMS